MTTKIADITPIEQIARTGTVTNWPGYIAAGLLFAVGWLMIHSYAELPAEPQSTLNATPDRSPDLLPKQAAADPAATLSIAH
jgi:hypothetical protein